MDLDLTGRSALVLAASKGLGKAIAASFCSEGVRTVVCSSNLERIEEAAHEIGAHAIQADLDRPESALPLARACTDLIGVPDILVINCGGPEAGSFLETSAHHWDINYQRLWAMPIELLRLILPAMAARGSGRVLWVTSVAAKENVPNVTISSSLRAGLHGLVKSLSDEFAGRGVTVNALVPGFMNTDRLKHLSLDDLSNVHIPMGRFGEPEEFAALATFLSSRKASYITGQTIACDGGWLRG